MRRPLAGLLTLAFSLAAPLGADDPPPDARVRDWRQDWTLAGGFAITPDTEGYNLPTAIAFVPEPGPDPGDPLSFVTELRGTVKVVSNDRTVRIFAADFLTSEFNNDASPDGSAEFGLAPTGQIRFTDLFAPFESGVSHQIGPCQVSGDTLYVSVGDGFSTGESWRLPSEPTDSRLTLRPDPARSAELRSAPAVRTPKVVRRVPRGVEIARASSEAGLRPLPGVAKFGTLPGACGTGRAPGEERDVSDQEDDFGRLLDASLRTKSFTTGQQVEGTIVALLPDVAFIDVGDKGEASLALEELKDADGNLAFKIGDSIEAFVVSTAGGLTLSRRMARGAATRQQLEQAFQMGLPVEGKVEKANKGGFDVRVAGARAFCPVSQIDVARDTAPAEHVGRVYSFRITEYREGGRHLVVSRRVLQEEEQQRQAEALRASIVPGAVMTGRVATVLDYGAFVDLGAGVQGLVHVSEMAWSRASEPAQIVRPGEEITVKVLRVDENKSKIALSLKALQVDPWSDVAATYAVGQVHAGRVTRLTEFGAFVELEPGVEALAHASAFPQTGKRDEWRTSFRPGTTGSFEIQSIELDRKRMGVAPVPEGSTRGADVDAASGAHASEDIHGFGSMAEQLRDALRPRKPKG